MITKFKIFENKTHPFLNVGDYVKVNYNGRLYGFNDNEKIKNIINTTIGQVKSFEGGEFIWNKEQQEGKWANPDIFVEFSENVYRPFSLKFKNKNIEEYGSTKEELEAKLAAKKHNI